MTPQPPAQPVLADARAAQMNVVPQSGSPLFSSLNPISTEASARTPARRPAATLAKRQPRRTTCGQAVAGGGTMTTLDTRPSAPGLDPCPGLHRRAQTKHGHGSPVSHRSCTRGYCPFSGEAHVSADLRDCVFAGRGVSRCPRMFRWAARDLADDSEPVISQPRAPRSGSSAATRAGKTTTARLPRSASRWPCSRRRGAATTDHLWMPVGGSQRRRHRALTSGGRPYPLRIRSACLVTAAHRTTSTRPHCAKASQRTAMWATKPMVSVSSVASASI